MYDFGVKEPGIQNGDCVNFARKEIEVQKVIKVKVEYLPGISYITGKKFDEVEVENDNLYNLVDELTRKYGMGLRKAIIEVKSGKINNGILIFINDQIVRNLDVPIREGDKVVFSPVLAGG